MGGLIELVDQLAKEAENEKMKVRSAVGLGQEPCRPRLYCSAGQLIYLTQVLTDV